jgi:hypothetical protein
VAEERSFGRAARIQPLSRRHAVLQHVQGAFVGILFTLFSVQLAQRRAGSCCCSRISSRAITSSSSRIRRWSSMHPRMALYTCTNTAPRRASIEPSSTAPAILYNMIFMFSSSAWGFPESLPPFDPRRRRSSSRAGSWAGQYGLPRAGIVLHGVPAFVVAWHSVCSFVSPVNRGEGYTGPPPAVRYRRRNAAKGLCWACSRSLRIRSAVRLGRSSSRESCGVRLPMDGLNRVTSSLASGSGAGLRHMCRPAGARRTPASAA